MFRGRPRPTQKGYKRGYLVFHRKRLEPRVLPWQQYKRCHFVSFEMYISRAKFEDQSAPTFLEIFLIQYFIVLVELLIL